MIKAKRRKVDEYTVDSLGLEERLVYMIVGQVCPHIEFFRPLGASTRHAHQMSLCLFYCQHHVIYAGALK